jgi:hypothetical protein
MKAGRNTHDTALFEVLLAESRQLDQGVREGRMFGCPAVYHGRKMAACVYGEQIGLRVPEAIAADSIRAGRATAFRPYGKPAMREWIQINPRHSKLAAYRDLLGAAIAFAEANNG